LGNFEQIPERMSAKHIEQANFAGITERMSS
jgi:hypothetical protein